ncbi:hypothetical protein [Nocardioides albidus]|uniref:hypothetical protein n=1 Tax=Nocardioides albidus TaxID=1517589 RepID=UPI00130539AB|nr:hypothetical protein [Nocardioides albidus]
MSTYRLVNGPDHGQLVAAQPDLDQVVRRCGGGVVYVATNTVGADGFLEARAIFD